MSQVRCEEELNRRKYFTVQYYQIWNQCNIGKECSFKDIVYTIVILVQKKKFSTNNLATALKFIRFYIFFFFCLIAVIKKKIVSYAICIYRTVKLYGERSACVRYNLRNAFQKCVIFSVYPFFPLENKPQNIKYPYNLNTRSSFFRIQLSLTYLHTCRV